MHYLLYLICEYAKCMRIEGKYLQFNFLWKNYFFYTYYGNVGKQLIKKHYKNILQFIFCFMKGLFNKNKK